MVPGDSKDHKHLHSLEWRDHRHEHGPVLKHRPWTSSSPEVGQTKDINMASEVTWATNTIIVLFNSLVHEHQHDLRWQCRPQTDINMAHVVSQPIDIKVV